MKFFKHLCSASALLLCTALAVSCGRKEEIRQYEGYRLAWHDEFDYKGLPDAEKWNATNIGGVINHELQDYRKDDLRCTRVDGGKLILEAFHDPHEGVVGWSKSKNVPYHFEYSSGEVHTDKKVDFQYGRIDIMARIPSGPGLWPALWLMPVKTQGSSYAEIDLMEHVWSLGQNHNTIQATVHTQHTMDKHEGFTPVNAGYISSSTLSTEFHLYSLVWDEEKLVAMFDDEPYFTYERPAEYDWGNWPFRQPFYLILNIAVGGSWGGEVDSSIFPQRMEVDYIRYYIPE